MSEAGQTPPVAPKVSVFLLTHDHRDWIGEAIESALAQTAPFPIEILIADDFSTDGTREVVCEYAERYPDRIRTYLPERNLGVAGIWLAAARQCRGEYVAILEGDDYWTSPGKLARQAALLDSRLGWTSCFHRATLFHDDGSRPSRPATPAFDRDEFDLDDLLRACFIPFLTVMFRRDVLAGVPDWVFGYRWFDWLFHIFCARQGAVGFLDEDMARYRVHSGGNWSARNRTTQLEEDLIVYERLLRELPERRSLLERCLENRRCQMAVESAGVPVGATIALGEPEPEMPVYFNGRHAAHFDLGGFRAPAAWADRLREIACGGEFDVGQGLHYPPATGLREASSEHQLAYVVPRSADRALEAQGSPAALLGGEAKLVWSDEWCRIWEAEIDCSAAPSQERGNEEMGALLEISDISLVEPLPAGLHDRFLDEPKRGAVLDARAVDVLGWVLGEESKAVAVEFTLDGDVFWRTPAQLERPDVAEAFSDRPEAGRSGFKATLNLIGAEPVVELGVQAVLAGQRRLPLATIEARRRWRRDRSPEFSQLVSVVIPCAGHAHYLGEAIESVLGQTYPHLEVVVVDDESPDNATAIASRYAGVKRLSTDGEGVSAARNVGIRNTNGDFLVFLDADDRLLPDAIEVGLRRLEEHPECAAAIGAYVRTSHDGKPIDTHDQPPVEREQYAALMRNNWAGFPGRAIYRRAVFEHVRGFDPGRRAAEDFALNLEVMRQFPVCSHEAVVVEHREHNRNSSADAAMMLTETLAALKAQRSAVKRDPQLRAAYREGTKHMKVYYGDLLAAQARESLRERHPGEALREAALLARHHPRGLLHVFSSSPPPSTL